MLKEKSPTDKENRVKDPPDEVAKPEVSKLRNELELIRRERDEHRLAQQRERQRLLEKVVRLEEDARAHIKEKTVLQEELMLANKRNRQTSEHDDEIHSDYESKYRKLKSQVQDLEKIHSESKKKHALEVATLTSELDHYRKVAVDQKDRVLQTRERQKNSERNIETLEARLSELQSSNDVLQEKLKLAQQQSQSVEEQALKEKDLHRRAEVRLQDAQDRIRILEDRMSDDGKALREKAMSASTEAAVLREKNAHLEAKVALLRGQKDDTSLALRQARIALADLASQYGRLASSTVEKTTFDEMGLELAQTCLQRERLRHRLVDREAQVAELVRMIGTERENREVLERILQDTEMQLRHCQAGQHDRDVCMKDQSEDSHLFQSFVNSLLADLHVLHRMLSFDAAAKDTLSSSYLILSQDSVSALAAMAETLTESISHHRSIIQRVVQAEETITNLRSEAIAAADAHQATLVLLSEKTAELETLQAGLRGLKLDFGKLEDQLRQDVVRAETALGNEIEQGKDKDKQLIHCQIAEDALRADIDGLVKQIENMNRYEDAYNNLLNEVRVLVGRNALAEDEAIRLSDLNAEILSHTNPHQKIFYVDKIRRELAEVKQQLVATTCERDIALKVQSDLTAELATYKSVAVPMDTKPRTHLTRVQRVVSGGTRGL